MAEGKIHIELNARDELTPVIREVRADALRERITAALAGVDGDHWPDTSEERRAVLMKAYAPEVDAVMAALTEEESTG